MPALTFSAALDTNIPIVEEFPDGLKASAYFEDYLFKLFQDIENINVIAGIAYGVVNGDAGTATAAAPSDPISIIGGVSISTVAADGAPDSLIITNDDPFPEAPIDGQPYGRRDAGWVDLDTLFIGDAPSDGTIYGRLNAAWVNATLQRAYDAATAVPQITINATPDALTIDASVAGDIFAVRDDANLDWLRVATTGMSFGRAGRRHQLVTAPDSTGRFGTEVYPDDYSITTATGTGSVFYTDPARTISLLIPGGGGVGNDTAPGGMNFVHTVEFLDPGFLFASQLLINAAVRINAQAAVGPLYLFLDQYTTFGDGGAFVCSQHNTIRAQPRWGPNVNGGSITQVNATLFFASSFLDATVGSTSITTLTYFAAFNPTLVAGATIGTFNAFDIANISGPTTIRGINSAMGSGTFINHTGVAISAFAGDIHMNNAIALVLGSVGVNRVELLRPSAGVARMIGVGGTNNEGLDWDFDFAANVINVTSSTGATLRISNRFDINNGIALGGGAAATLGTIGGAGPTVAAQAQWVEIDIGGVAHWIPVWV